MLSELVLLFLKADRDEASELINSVFEKKVPTVEEFEDGSIVILRSDLTVGQDIMLALYHHYPNRLTSTDLSKSVKSGFGYINKLLTNLENQRFVHQRSGGYKLTKLGIKHVEDEILTKKV